MDQLYEEKPDIDIDVLNPPILRRNELFPPPEFLHFGNRDMFDRIDDELQSRLEHLQILIGNPFGDPMFMRPPMGGLPQQYGVQ